MKQIKMMVAMLLMTMLTLTSFANVDKPKAEITTLSTKPFGNIQYYEVAIVWQGSYMYYQCVSVSYTVGVFGNYGNFTVTNVASSNCPQMNNYHHASYPYGRDNSLEIHISNFSEYERELLKAAKEQALYLNPDAYFE